MKTIPVSEFLKELKNETILDVRSPAEFAKGHITKALNLPIVDDEERKIVGIEYKQKGRISAIQLALDIAADRVGRYFSQLKSLGLNGKIGIYCWRGGMRSEAMAHLFQTVCQDVIRLQKGYQAYRNYVLNSFQKHYNLLILSGMTGSGKTQILEMLRQKGEQIIDLEALANHKGSAFGSIGMIAQPTYQQFENDLFFNLDSLDSNRRLWIEDESQMIGKVKIPDAFFKQMRSAKVIKIIVSKKKRIANLIKEYTDFPDDLLQKSTKKIERRLGGKNTKIVLEAISQKDYQTAIDIVLAYYDKTYQYGLAKRSPDKIYSLSFQNYQAKEITNNIIHLANLISE